MQVEAEWYREWNTTVYWHVLPSIIIPDEHYTVDMRQINSLVKGALADGSGLVRHQLQHVDLSNQDAQEAILRSLIELKLRSGFSRAQLEKSCSIITISTMTSQWIQLSVRTSLDRRTRSNLTSRIGTIWVSHCT